MSNNLKTLTFATILCVVCSLLLTAAATGLKSFQERNRALDRQKNILMAFGLLETTGSHAAAEIEQAYRTSVRQVWVNNVGRIVQTPEAPDRELPLFVLVDGRSIAAYVVPIDSRGLWGPIHGYLAFDNDGKTIRGFTVYQHQETPGLGGEIESRWFNDNFKGKRIVDDAGAFVSIKIAKGMAADTVPASEQSNFVDGISGATMTGKFLSAGFREILEPYEPFAVRLRKGQAVELPGP